MLCGEATLFLCLSITVGFNPGGGLRMPPNFRTQAERLIFEDSELPRQTRLTAVIIESTCQRAKTKES